MDVLCNEYKYNNFLNDAMLFAEKSQLLRPELWRRFVQQFRENADGSNGWRGEYWGKMMRGACFVYTYTKNRKLYDILSQTICDMLDSADESGRISSYPKENEFDGWDMWCRKYVLLGMQYFYEICDDEKLKIRIVNSMTGQADYIIENVGKEPPKIPITSTSRLWRGLNSSSILEPVVRLYSITGEKRYLDFARYIVESGGIDVENIFELAYKNELMPYQYPITKAYEMISCFDGLLEYYLATNCEWCRTAVINFADRILETDFTVIGGCGCTYELLDHSTVRQANTTNTKIMQETCVTVTLMKYMYRLNILTGSSKYIDAFEISLYNAYLGAQNTEKIIEPLIKNEHSDWYAEPLPYDSYSPLTLGTRGNGIGGLRGMSDNHYYGCCACIGSMGIGLVPKVHITSTQNTVTVNLYIDGVAKINIPNCGSVIFKTETDYPRTGDVRIVLDMQKKTEFELKLRNPYWSKNTVVSVNGSSAEVKNGYVSITKIWNSGDVIELKLDVRTEAIKPIPYGHQILMNKNIGELNYTVPSYDKEDPEAKKHIAFRRGPIMLAQDGRMKYDIAQPIQPVTDSENYVNASLCGENGVPFKHIVAVDIPLTGGSSITLADYSSCGKMWNENDKLAAWISVKQ